MLGLPLLLLLLPLRHRLRLHCPPAPARSTCTFCLPLDIPSLCLQIRPIVDKYNAASLVAMSCWTFPQLADAVLTMNASARQLLNDTAWGMPGQPGGENLSSAQAAAAWANYLALGIRGFSVGFETLTPTFIQQAHARLLPVYAWTVDSAA